MEETINNSHFVSLSLFLAALEQYLQYISKTDKDREPRGTGDISQDEVKRWLT